MKDIVVKGAREHNLRDIDVVLPRDKLIVITGLSGSGKSTLAFDTIYAEGQRRYVESLSSYARQFLGLMNKPDVDSIDGLSPAISIEQKTTSKNPRSTVGTVTEIYDYLRLLFARVGTAYCPEHNVPIEPQSPQRIVERIIEENKGVVNILSPIIRQKKGTYEQLLKDLDSEGYTRVRVDKAHYRVDDEITLDRYKKHDIEVVVGRVDLADLNEETRFRLTEAVELALEKSGGLVVVLNADDSETLLSSKMACPVCGLVFEELQPRMFSFNSPFGACDQCHGLGIKMDFDEDLIIPDKTKSIAEGAIALYKNYRDGWRVNFIGAFAKHFGFDLWTPIQDLNEKQYNVLMYGASDRVPYKIQSKRGSPVWSGQTRWEGLIPQSERLYNQTESDGRRRDLERFMRVSPCPQCKGKRLKEKVLAVRINEKSIIDVTDLCINDSIDFFDSLRLNSKQEEIARLILKELQDRLGFLHNVGLGYLNLSRSAGTLSGGEAQRIRLATQIGSNLMGVLYILDEPSIGLHQRDNKRLLETLEQLRDVGNTLIVVEHDEETIRSADYVVDMGPGAGLYGGDIVCSGTPETIMDCEKSLTGKYLSGELCIPTPTIRRKAKGYAHVLGCKEHNLKNIDISVPLETLCCVTGVSGSGKSTFVYDILYKAMMKKLHNSKVRPGSFSDLKLDGKIDKVIVIDQSPIGKTPRSNPATYTKVFDEIRKLFSKTKEAKLRGYKPGRFSFNVKGGRCEACRGDGLIKIEMNFLPDIYVECEECKGKRYNQETLEVRYKGKNIAEVLDMSVSEALDLFENVPFIKRKIKTLVDVGLGYIKLGQSSTTLSGGEAQRIKLTRELSKRSTGSTLYLLDEPTTGLHFHDVKKLIGVLNRLVDMGNTVVVIEHNLDVVKCSDYIIDLGPEGGDDGGTVVAKGTPENVSKVKTSYTGQEILPLLTNKKITTKN